MAQHPDRPPGSEPRRLSVVPDQPVRRGRRRTREDWQRSVFRARVPDPVRVLLLRLAVDMAPDRTVSVRRADLAASLDRSERRVSARIAEAVAAGWLVPVHRGHNGRPATYQGTWPSGE